VVTAPDFQHVRTFARSDGPLWLSPPAFHTELRCLENTPVQLQRPGGCRDAHVIAPDEEIRPKLFVSQPQSSNTWRCTQCFGPGMLLSGCSGIRSAAKSPLSGTAFALDASAQKTRNHTTAIQRCGVGGTSMLRQGNFEMAGTILLTILILLLLGAIPAWPHSRKWGYGPSGGLGLIVTIIIILLLLERI
jgi:hypothetical protein